MELIVLQTGVILGLTAVIGKFVPDRLRDAWLPVVALLMGIGAVMGTEGISVLLAFKGIVMGGTITGLYGVAKDMKQTPQVVQQQ